MSARPLLDLIEARLTHMLAAAAIAFAGYLTGGVTTGEAEAEAVRALDARMDIMERKADKRFQFMQCAVRTIDKLADNGGPIARPCELEVTE